MKTPSLVEVF